MNGDKNFEGMRIAGKGAWLLWFPFILFAWSPPVNISNTESLSTYPSMCIDRRGWLHVVWEEREGRHEVYYTFFTGDTWGIPVNISNDSNYSVRPDVAVDTLNRVHVVWCDWPPGRILWCYMEGGIWSSPVCISESIQADNEGPELVVNPLDNTVHCVWHGISGTESVIWYSFWDGESWSIPENISSLDGYGAWADIAVDSLGSLHVVWMDYGTEDIFYSCRDGTTWSSPVNISNLSGQSCDPRIAIDRDNNPHVVWEERGGGKIHYTMLTDSGWMEPVCLSLDSTGFLPVIACDSFSYPHVVWGSYTYGMRYIFYNGREWGSFDTLGYGSQPAMAMDSHGVLHLIWQAYGDIWYRYHNPVYENVENFEVRCPLVVYTGRLVLKVPFICESVSFYDVMGRLLYKERIRKRGHIQCMLDFPSGVYFLRLEAAGREWWYRLILLNP
ncbi:hypothetical protein DRQ18_08055 [bacterium]|nr:MAG: hypothetical protein DRQ18_08055 [bacterium]